MPVAVDPKSARPCFSVRHGGSLVTVACHRVPQAAQPPATRPWNGSRATRGPMSWSAGTQRNSPRQAPCRGLDLVGPGSLSGSEACRSPGPAGAHVAPRHVFCNVILSLERPSRQAPLAGALIFCLVYFVFEWLNKDQRGFRQARGRPCRGELLLPVHKLGY